jgi:hypothetical protein
MTDKTDRARGIATTLLVLVVDRSGSMESIRSDMEGGIKTLLDDQANEPGKCLVTLAQFDTVYELLFHAIPVAEVVGYELIPRGGTALLDAIGRTIGEVKGWIALLPAGSRLPQVVFAVVTDGEENSSQEWSKDKVMAAVKDCSDAGWNFSFLGANQDAIQEGGNLGVGSAAAMTYSPTSAGVSGAMSSLSASVRRVRSGTDSSLAYTEEERRRSGSG